MKRSNLWLLLQGLYAVLTVLVGVTDLIVGTDSPEFWPLAILMVLCMGVRHLLLALEEKQ